MAWLKVDDKMHDHPKVRRLLRSGEARVDAAPMGLWQIAGSWCADNGTDGFVPEYLLDRWDANALELASRLVSAGLWEPSTSDDGDAGYLFHDWADYQPLRAQIEADRANNRRKVELHRDELLLDAVKQRDAGLCRYCGTAVKFSDHKSAVGGTYDHIDPQGLNTLDNVVVSCRGCNSSKGARTPEQWGRELLKPRSKGPLRRVRPNLTAVPNTSDAVPNTPDAVPNTSDAVPNTTRMGEGSRPGRAGPGSGRDGSGPDTDPIPNGSVSNTAGAS